MYGQSRKLASSGPEVRWLKACLKLFECCEQELEREQQLFFQLAALVGCWPNDDSSDLGRFGEGQDTQKDFGSACLERLCWPEGLEVAGPDE